MKKFLSLLLAAAMVFSVLMLASCGGSEEPAKTTVSASEGENKTGEATKPADNTPAPTQTKEDEKETKVLDGETAKDAVRTSVNTVIDKLLGGDTAAVVPTLTNLDFGVDVEEKITISDALLSIIASVLTSRTGAGESAPQIDLSFLKELSFKSSVDVKGTLAAVSALALLNGKELLDGTIVLDLENKALKVKSQILGNQYLELPFEQLASLLSGLFGQRGMVEEYDDYDDYDYEGYDDFVVGEDYPDGEIDFPEGELIETYVGEDGKTYGVFKLPDGTETTIVLSDGDVVMPSDPENPDYPIDDYYNDDDFGGGFSLGSLDVQTILGMLSGVKAALPDAQTLKDIVNRYIDIVLAAIGDPVKGEKEVAVVDLTTKYNTLTYEISVEKLYAIVMNVLKTAKDDAQLLGVIDRVAGAVGYGGENGNAISETLKGAIAEFLEKNANVNLANSKPFSVKVVLYSDGYGDVKGVDAVIVYEDTEVALTELCAQSGSKTAVYTLVEFGKTGEQKQSLKATYTDTKSGSRITGDLIVYFGDAKLIDIYVKDLDVELLKEGKFSGKISISLNDVFTAISTFMPGNESIEAVKSMFGLFGDITVYFEGKDTDAKRSYKFGVANAQQDLIAAECTIVKRDAKPIEAVQGISLEEFVKTADMNAVLGTLMQKLIEAGVPQDLLASLPIG